MKIFLIGMPGSGKTTLGKQLAAERNLKFLDLDQEIERQEKISVAQLFDQRGEEYFRKVESDLLHHWVSAKEDFIMATGGGAPCFHKGIQIINENGISIFLDVPIDVLVERTMRHKHRPLLQTENKQELRDRLSMLFEKRKSCYESAAIKLTDPTLVDVLAALESKK
jgi:shikimate kinase